jgi:hypothetical protein
MTDENSKPTQLVIVDGQALQKLIDFITAAPLPFGRDALVQAVVQSSQPAEISEE